MNKSKDLKMTGEHQPEATSVEYATGFTAITRPVPRYGILQLAPGKSPTGYGKRISTDYMVKFEGDHRLYRVYAVCYSNSASHYIKRGGKTLFLRSHELEAALGR